MTLKAGDVLFIPAGTIHVAKNVGSGNAAELATNVVGKGKPLLTLASERPLRGQHEDTMTDIRSFRVEVPEAELIELRRRINATKWPEVVAGDRAARLYANAEATSYYEQALSVARALSESADSQRRQIDAILKLPSVSSTRQDLERDHANLSAAHALAEQLQDQRRLAQVLYWLGRTQYVLGDTQAAVAYATQSLEIADAAADEALAAPPVNLIGRIYQLSSRPARGWRAARSRCGGSEQE